MTDPIETPAVGDTPETPAPEPKVAVLAIHFSDTWRDTDIAIPIGSLLIGPEGEATVVDPAGQASEATAVIALSIVERLFREGQVPENDRPGVLLTRALLRQMVERLQRKPEDTVQ